MWVDYTTIGARLLRGGGHDDQSGTGPASARQPSTNDDTPATVLYTARRVTGRAGTAVMGPRTHETAAAERRGDTDITRGSTDLQQGTAEYTDLQQGAVEYTDLQQGAVEYTDRRRPGLHRRLRSRR